MKSESRYRISIASAVLVLAILVALTVWARPGLLDLLPSLLFGALILLTMTFGVALVEGEVSLLPTTTVAACLAVGPLAAGWAAFLASIAHGLVRYFGAGRLGLPPRPGRASLVATTAANATMHTASVLLADLAFGALGGAIPLLRVSLADLPALLLLGLAYLAANYGLAGLFIATRGPTALRAYARSLPNLLFFEGSPLVFAPLAALIYTRLGVPAFLLFAFIPITASLITRYLAFTSRRLARRIKELDSLRAVGQALSSSLDVEVILRAIYDQVATLMPARSFYVALYDPDTDEVSFPLAVDDGEPARWRSRRAGNGLTEYVLRTRAPLLISGDVQATLERLGLDQIGNPAACWLGVPLLAGLDPLGVVAVQSYSTPEAYDASHQEILTTIAAQAAVAIQNARLYARTDEALSRRVQELGSILSTTREGILLVDLDCRVVTANRALAEMLGVAQGELVGRAMAAHGPGEAASLGSLLGLGPTELEAGCAALPNGEELARKQVVVLGGAQQRHVERTLTAVRDRQGQVTGWLVALRDVTEEVELARLREDMTGMLVHDLRSPLTVIKGSLDMLSVVRDDDDRAHFDRLLAMAGRGADQLLRLVSDLLDISRLEQGQLSVSPEPVEVEPLLHDIAGRFSPLLTTSDLTVQIAAEPGLPHLYVDRRLVERVLSNLVDNAVKFTPNGGRIGLWACLDPEPGPALLRIGVTDTGPGIPLEKQHRLFQKFQRLETTYGRWTGTGLGLSFCKLAVEAHGGRIWVESAPGKGSTFVVALPAAQDGPQV